MVSVSGEFQVLDSDPQVSAEESQKLLAVLSSELGEAYEYSQATDHLQQAFTSTAKKKSKLKSLVAVVAAVAIAIVTSGATTNLIATTMGKALAESAIGLAVSAGAGAVASSVAMQAISSGKVDWGQVLKSGATAALTAGLLNAPVFEGGASLNQLANIQNTAGELTKATFNPETFGSNLVAMTGRAIVTASVSTAINGGSFGEAMKQSLIKDLAAVGANAIGNTWGGGKDPVTQTLAHAGLGATVAKLNGQDAVAGAIGGATESVLGNLLDLPVDENGNYSTGPRVLYTSGAMLAGGLAAYVTGHDPLAAAGAAENAATNNYLDHHPPDAAALSEKERYENAVAACANDDSAACDTKLALAKVSQERDQALAKACSGGSLDLCSQLARQAMAMGNVVYGNYGSYVYANSQGTGAIRYLNTATIGTPNRPAGFDTKLAPSVIEAAANQGGALIFGGFKRGLAWLRGETAAAGVVEGVGTYESAASRIVTDGEMATKAGTGSPLVGQGVREAGELTGTRTAISSADDAVTIRSLTRENESATTLANNGYKVEQNPRTLPNGKNPDYIINGQIFDNYAPTTGNVRNAADAIGKKVASGQADNIVVNLADSSITPAVLREQLMTYPIPGLKQVIVIDKAGAPTAIKFPGK